MIWATMRIAAAVLAASGWIAGFVVNVSRAQRFDEDLGLVIMNYFSFLTIFTTLLTVIILTVAGVWDLRHPGTSPEPFAVALSVAMVTAPAILIGVVYNILLRGLPSEAALTDPPLIYFCDRWAIEVMHVVLPLYLLADLLFASRRRALPWWSLSVLVGYPLVWTVYTMIRGELVVSPDGNNPWWYPYPFLDPHGEGGYASVFMYIGAITGAFIVIGVILIAVGRHRARRAARSAPAMVDTGSPTP
ncbi:Pr6Pr family membrane protein [Microbacter sp. GSS18]|nr:Pr6Pr family membrane protein [Microbacter sp. GSS18]